MDIIELFFSMLNMFNVFFLFLAAFVLLPLLVIHIDKETAQRHNVFFTLFTISSAVVMIGLPLASMFKMTDSVSVIILTVITLTAITLYRKKQMNISSVTIGEKILIYFLDISDKDMGLVNEIKFFAGAAWRNAKKYMGNFVQNCKDNGMLCVFNVLLFASAIMMRGIQAWQHYYLASSDAYLHLLWTKYFVNEGLYHDGIYPHGMHVALAYMTELFNMDAYLAFRYLGPGISLLILFSIYQFVRRHFYTNQYAPSLAVGAYLFMASIPTQPWRQLSVLPQEYALIFVLPTLHFLMEYGNTKTLKYLRLYTLGLIVAGFVHTYAVFFILLGSLFYFVFNAKSFIDAKRLKITILYMLSGLVIGSSPMVIAFLMGIKFHRSFEFAVSSVSTGIQNNDIGMVINGLFLKDFVLLAICILAVMMLFMTEKRVNSGNGSVDRLDRISFTLTTTMIYILYRSSDLNLVSVMHPDRVGVFLSVFVSVLFGAISGLFIALIGRAGFKHVLEGAAAVVLLLAMIIGYGIHIPVATQYEYDQSAKAYLTISNNPDSRELTLIAPQEQFQEIYGRGYHYQLWQLVADQSDINKKELIVPTPEIYVFVEKIPFGYSTAVNMQMAQEAMPTGVSDPNEYYNQYREMIEARAYYWAEDFLRRYPDQVSIYYEDTVLKIYRIKQDILAPLNLKTSAPAEVYGK